MVIKKCYVENFGKLHEFLYLFETGICQIEEKNGWGKSTLAAFLGAMFYGMPRTRRQQLSENDRLRYKPWQGGNYGGYVEFEAGHQVYRLTRFFEEKEDHFSCIDVSTGMEARQFSANIGEELFGIDRESFYKTVYLATDDINIVLTDSISTRLADTKDIEESTDYEGAVQRLEAARRELKKTGKRGALDQLEAQMAEVKQRLRGMEQQSEQLTILREKRKQIDQKLQFCKTQLEERISAQSEELEKQAAIRRKLLAAGIEEEPKGHTSKLLLPVGFIIMIVAVIVAVKTQSTVFAAAGTVCGLLLIVGALGQSSREERRRQETHAKKQQQFEQLKRELAQMDREKENYAQMSSQQEERLQLERERDTVNLQLKELEDQVDERIRLEELLEKQQTEWQTMTERLETVELTLQFLRQAKESYASNYLNRLTQVFQDNLQKLGIEEAWRYRIDVDLNVSYEAYGVQRASEYLSSGYQKCVKLALQLAMADALFEKEKPFLIVDDAMKELDREHTEMAKKTLAEYSIFYQMIILQC